MVIMFKLCTEHRKSFYLFLLRTWINVRSQSGIVIYQHKTHTCSQDQFQGRAVVKLTFVHTRYKKHIIFLLSAKWLAGNELESKLVLYMISTRLNGLHWVGTQTFSLDYTVTNVLKFTQRQSNTNRLERFCALKTFRVTSTCLTL